jgi:DNA-binding transcriptional LysR family regulator
MLMELRQLEYFVAVAEERTFTRAAERVHISQSGVSAQIRQLECELGLDLFDRSTRTATLTVAGKAALEPARAALATIASLHQTVSAVIGLLRGRLAVGMVTGCTVTPLFDALATFHQAHPGVEILLLEGASDQLVHQVRAGHLDLALVGCATTPDGLETLTITQDRLVAAVQPGHPSPGGRDLPCTTSPPTPSCACRREPDCAQCSTRDLRLLLAEPGELADPAQQFLAIGRRRPHRGRVTAVLIDDELAELLHPLGHRAGKSVQRGLP